MSRDDARTNQSPHDDASIDQFPGEWQRISDESEAYLEHRNGAKLIIRRTAPPAMPDHQTPSVEHGDHFELDFQPAGREGLVPIVETGSKKGQRYEAERFAALAPDGRPDVELFAGWVTEDQL